MKKNKILSLITTVALIGSISAYSYEEGVNNTFLGQGAGSTVETGDSHTFIGANAGANQESGSYNTFLGYGSGRVQETGGDNTLLGALSGNSNIAGYGNVFVGTSSGFNNTGSNNVFIGFESGMNSEDDSDTLMIQNSSTDTPLIYGKFDNDLLRVNGFIEVNATKKVINPEIDAYPAMSFSAEDIPQTEMLWSMGLIKLTALDAEKFFIRNFVQEQSPFQIYGSAQNNAFTIGSPIAGNENNIGIGTGNPVARLDVRGDIGASFDGDDSANTRNLLALDAYNAGAGGSDVGFSMENKDPGFKWVFRTYAPGEGFAASKIGTGGTEFAVDNLGATLGTTVVKMGGVTVFENGHLVTASSRELKTDIKPLDTQAALDAFHKLQPVSYAYKAHKDEAVVGFIAEDVPELVAMPSRKSIDSTEIVAVLTSVLAETRAEAKAKDAEMEVLKKKVAMMESILTNLALDTSNTSKEKISLK